MPLLLGFLLRIESMNELKFRLQEDEFINVFSRRTMLPKIDTIRDTLKVLETQGLKAICLTLLYMMPLHVIPNGSAIALVLTSMWLSGQKKTISTVYVE